MYKVTYIDKGKKNTEIIYKTNFQEIYNDFIKKGKVILKISKHTSFSFIKSKQTELAHILQALSDALSAGMSLSSAIQTVMNSISEKSVYKQVFAGIYNYILLGKSFPEAVQNYSVYFGETAVQMIKAGYETGNLPKTLEVVSYYLNELTEIKKEMIRKIIYPILVFIVSLMFLLINTLFIIPRLLKSPMFAIATEIETSKITIQILKLLSMIIPLAVLIFLILILLLIIFYRINQKRIEIYLLKIPFLKEMIFYRAYFISFFSMSKLLNVGIRLSSALKIIEKSNTIYIIKNEFMRANDLLKKGNSFVDGFKNITKFERQLLSWSLNIDRLAKNLEIVSRRFYSKYIASIKRFSPFIYTFSLLLVVSVFLLTFISVFVPYLKLIGQLGGGIK